MTDGSEPFDFASLITAHDDGNFAEAVVPPIFQTSTFVFENSEAGKSFFSAAYGLREKGENEVQGLIYGRINNPNLEILEDRLTLWDNAEACTVFGSVLSP